MLTDLHPELGPKRRVNSLEAVEAYVRNEWPRARIEGSAGMQQSFWMGPPGEDAVLVAHCWEVRGRRDELWVRRSRRTELPA